MSPGKEANKRAAKELEILARVVIRHTNRRTRPYGSNRNSGTGDSAVLAVRSH